MWFSVLVLLLAAAPALAQEAVKRQDRHPAMPAIEAVAPAIKVRTERIVVPASFAERWALESPRPPDDPKPWVRVKTRPATSSARIRYASLPRGGDICTRHGMHKVHYGRRWRCRR